MRLGVKREHGVHACTVGHTYVRVVVKSFHDQSPILFVYKVLKGCMYNVIFVKSYLIILVVEHIITTTRLLEQIYSSNSLNFGTCA